jgi:hypothetical protein
MDGKPIMPGKIQKLGIELQFGTSLNHHTLEVIIPMSVSDSSHLPIGLDMALQKELQALPRIESYIEVSGVGQNHHKPIGHSPRQTLLHPIYLSLFPGEKRQFMVSLPPLLTILLCPETDRGITALKFITL